jgi:hypothetical protein
VILHLGEGLDDWKERRQLSRDNFIPANSYAHTHLLRSRQEHLRGGVGRGGSRHQTAEGRVSTLAQVYDGQLQRYS